MPHPGTFITDGALKIQYECAKTVDTAHWSSALCNTILTNEFRTPEGYMVSPRHEQQHSVPDYLVTSYSVRPRNGSHMIKLMVVDVRKANLTDDEEHRADQELEHACRDALRDIPDQFHVYAAIFIRTTICIRYFAREIRDFRPILIEGPPHIYRAKAGYYDVDEDGEIVRQLFDYIKSCPII